MTRTTTKRKSKPSSRTTTRTPGKPAPAPWRKHMARTPDQLWDWWIACRDWCTAHHVAPGPAIIRADVGDLSKYLERKTRVDAWRRVVETIRAEADKLYTIQAEKSKIDGRIAVMRMRWIDGYQEPPKQAFIQTDTSVHIDIGVVRDLAASLADLTPAELAGLEGALDAPTSPPDSNQDSQDNRIDQPAQPQQLQPLADPSGLAASPAAASATPMPAVLVEEESTPAAAQAATPASRQGLPMTTPATAASQHDRENTTENPHGDPSRVPDGGTAQWPGERPEEV